MHTKCQVGYILKDGHTPKKNVELAADKFFQLEMSSTLTEYRKHSLKYLPVYPEGMGRHFVLVLTILTKFRLENAKLGNKDSPAIIISYALHVRCDKLMNYTWLLNAPPWTTLEVNLGCKPS